MTLREEYFCKRQALGMSQQEFAAIADVSEGMISLFERDEYVPPVEFAKIKNNVENYIRSLDRRKYLTIRVIEETLMLANEPEAEHQHTLSHLMIHVAKLNMMYLNDKEREEKLY